MALSIIWTASASKERNNTYGYWNRRNKSRRYSNKLDKLVSKSISSILANPNKNRHLNSKYQYVLVHKAYWLIFSKNHSHIIIHAFWDARQNPDKLNQRLK